jgi:hypothetical protein
MHILGQSLSPLLASAPPLLQMQLMTVQLFKSGEVGNAGFAISHCPSAGRWGSIVDAGRCGGKSQFAMRKPQHIRSKLPQRCADDGAHAEQLGIEKSKDVADHFVRETEKVCHHGRSRQSEQAAAVKVCWLSSVFKYR